MEKARLADGTLACIKTSSALTMTPECSHQIKVALKLIDINASKMTAPRRPAASAEEVSGNRKKPTGRVAT